jgi:uncharacterized peroxidase-related enzyme
MPWIREVAEADAEGELREVYDRIVSSRGKLSNIMRVQSLSPRAMQAHLDLYITLLFERSGVTRVERELVAVVVSATNGCAYCVSHHAAALNAYWRDDDRVAGLVADHTRVELSTRERAIADYAVSLTRGPAAVEERQITAMREAGLTDEEILNVNLVASYFNFVNRIAEGLGVEHSPEEVGGYRY